MVYDMQLALLVHSLEARYRLAMHLDGLKRILIEHQISGFYKEERPQKEQLFSLFQLRIERTDLLASIDRTLLRNQRSLPI